jgi:hypothetical protein
VFSRLVDKSAGIFGEFPISEQTDGMISPEFLSASVATQGYRHFEKALFTINGTIARATSSGMDVDLPELLRIKSQILRHDMIVDQP